MQLWKLTDSNPNGLTDEQIAEEAESQRLVYEDAMGEEGCRVLHFSMPARPWVGLV